MNACNQCTETQPVPTCISLLTLGQAEADTDYWVYIKNNATGYETRQDFTTESDGLVKLDLNNPYPDTYTENFYYMIWVTPVDESKSLQVPIIIDSVEYLCFTTRFERSFSDDLPAEYTTYSLSI